MIAYMDMTFCSFYKNCAKAKECHRPLTEDHIRRAKEVGLPVSQYAVIPLCHVRMEENK